MNKSKSVFVTALFAVMLAAIDAGMYKLFPLGFFVLTGALALFGLLGLAVVFSSWLAEKPEEPALDLPTVANFTPDDQLPEDFGATVEEIMREVQSENV